MTLTQFKGINSLLRYGVSNHSVCLQAAFQGAVPEDAAERGIPHIAKAAA